MIPQIIDLINQAMKHLGDLDDLTTRFVNMGLDVLDAWICLRMCFGMMLEKYVSGRHIQGKSWWVSTVPDARIESRD